MSLLNNLLEFSNMQSTSLFFCDSPKEVPPRPKELKQLLSARKEEEVTPEKRMASKSLTKMNLFSGAKVDPKQRLLHRMVHKLEMKRRKYYYNFFVVLENLKKNNVYRCIAPAKTTPQMSAGLGKLDQIAEILRLKYFDSALKKAAWRGISNSARERWAIGKLLKVMSKSKIGQFFKQMLAYSKKLEKEEMRLEILAASIKTIEVAQRKYHRFSFLQLAFKKIKNANLHKPKRNQQTSIMNTQNTLAARLEDFITPTKSFKADIISDFISPVPFPGYEQLKSRKKQIEQSPGKPQPPISLSLKQKQLKMIKSFNFLKGYSVRTALSQQPLEPLRIGESSFQIVRKCQPDPLNRKQISDLYDQNSLFFEQTLQSHMSMNNKCFPITESSVKSVRGDSKNFEDIRSDSQLTLIAPLSDHHDKKQITGSSVRSSAFGAEAVNFKNSLVVERQSMKDNIVVERFREKKEPSFLKVKQNIKREEPYIQSRLRMDSRYESAEKDYGSVKMRRQADLMIDLPQTIIDFSSIRSLPMTYRTDAPEQDYNRSNQLIERKHLSIVNGNKLTEEGRKTPTYIKVTKKI